MGAYVVMDVHCMGTRYFWNDIIVEGDPVFAIAERYLNKIPFPQTDFPKDLAAAYSVQFAKEYHVRGVIVFLHTHCDPFQWEVPVLKKYLSEIDIPVMALELDPVSASSQTKVRIEAFIEMLQGLIS
jgi:benzoyl-CoA reductase subunit C